jgi:hypothetical protein
MRRTLTVACLLAMSAGPAWADAVIERYSRSDGFAGMGAFESTSVQATSPTAQRDETKMRFTGGFLSAIQKMAGFGDSVRITRLDREVVWTLDPEKKTYTEAPLTAKGERERSGPTQPRPRQQEKGEPSDVVITKNEFKVEKTGAQKVINGFPCEEYLMTWLVETRNTKTEETSKSLMTDHLWTTPENAEIRQARAEEQVYAQAYLKKLGFQMSPAEARQFLAGLSGLPEEEQRQALAKVAAELAKVKGFTVVSDLTWSAEGSGGAGAKDGSQPRGGGGGGQPGMGELMGQLGKLFGGGQKSGSEARSGGGGDKTGSLFNLYTEVKSIRTLGPDPTRFEIPAGYTLKK